MDRNEERAGRREPGREDLHHEGREEELRGREDQRDEDELRYSAPKKSFEPALESAKPAKWGSESRYAPSASRLGCPLATRRSP